MSDVRVLARELYTVPEAARLLGVPPSTLRWWLEGRDEHPPVIRPTPTGSGSVTWGEFVEAGFLREYRRRRVGLPSLRRFIDRLRGDFGVPYPLAHARPFIGEGRRLMLTAQEEAGVAALVFELEGGQVVLDGRLEDFVERIDFAPEGERWAERIHPEGKRSPVVIDPELSSGAPTIAGIRTEALAELVDAGEPVEDVAEDFGLTVEDVKAATAYEWRAAAA